MESWLSVSNLDTGYDQLQILFDVSLSVASGERVVMLGSNGAGKTTLLKSMVGLQPMWRGNVELMGRPVGHLSTDARIRRGIAYVSDVGIVADLSVEDNLRIGGYHLSRTELLAKMRLMYDRFPILRERRNEAGGSLSGGQRKMLAVARGLMSDPKVMIMDEPSAGLSPRLVMEVIDLIRSLQGHDMSFLIAEQNVKFLEIATRVYVVDFGRVVFEGTVAELQENDAIRRAYFGMDAI